MTLADKIKFLASVGTLDSDKKAELLMIDRKIIDLIPAVKKESVTIDDNTKDRLILSFGELLFKMAGE